MLRRISLIKGIGTFAACDAGDAEFRKTTLVFGHNSFGKSTLAEVFRSLENGDHAELLERKSIPEVAEQKIVLKFLDGGSEKPVCFDKGKWLSAIPEQVTVHVFDSDFVSRNLFSGLKAERGNREAFSKFVLGEQGVAKANLVADQRKRAGALRLHQKELIRQLAAFGDIHKFVAIEVDRPLAELKGELQKLQDEASVVSQRVALIGQIRNRPFLAGLSPLNHGLEALHQLNALLISSSDGAHVRSRERVIEHIQQHTFSDGPQGVASAGKWLAEGVGFIKSDRCPFCEQDLRGASEIIDLYRSYFNGELQKLTDDVGKIVAELGARFTLIRSGPEAATAQRNSDILMAYPELEQEGEFRLLRENLQNLTSEVVRRVKGYEDTLRKFQKVVEQAISIKSKSPHEAVPALDLGDLIAEQSEIDALIVSANAAIQAMNEQLANFKSASNAELLQRRVQELTVLIKIQDQQIRRTENEPSCRIFKANASEIIQLEESIRRAQLELNEEQYAYLNSFFERINASFTALGSGYFTIDKQAELNTVGHQPVVSLIIKYNGVKIDPSRLGAVFSESDRRALALAVFWAKISSMTPQDRARAIVVLDDPVTSFDDNRISVAINLMRREALSLKQLIVFTHYHAFAKQWLQSEPLSDHLSFNRLTRNHETSCIGIGDSCEFLDSEQQKCYQRIVDFIARKSEQSVASDLRVFFESEIRDRYRDQIANSQFANADLGGVIDGLIKLGVFSDSVGKSAHFLRQALNPVHHELQSRTRDDWANLGRQLLKFVYTEL